MTDIPVLVAGGGPAGLAAAAELTQHGVPCVILEPRPQVWPPGPRAKTTSIRTVEHDHLGPGFTVLTPPGANPGLDVEAAAGH